MRQTRMIPILTCWIGLSLVFGGCIELNTSQGSAGAGGAGAGSAGAGGAGAGAAGNGGTGGIDETAHCQDDLKNESETDINCGGSDCPPCGLGAQCVNASDCMSGICSSDNQCVAPSCSDSMKNGAETDIDCGGLECKPCTAEHDCMVDTDCVSSRCLDKKCAELIIIGANVVPAQIPQFSISPPAGTASNDLLVLFVAHGGGADTVKPPLGWTEIQNGGSPNNDPRLDVFYRQHNGSANYQFSKNGSDGSAILAAFRGVQYGSRGAAENNLSVDIITNDVSTFLFVSLANGGGKVPAKPSGFTELALGNGNGRSMRVSYSEPMPAGMYTLTAQVGPGDDIPNGTFAMSIH